MCSAAAGAGFGGAGFVVVGKELCCRWGRYLVVRKAGGVRLAWQGGGPARMQRCTH